MRLFTIALTAFALVSVSTMAMAQEMPELPKPQQEHQWLAQLAGDWEAEIECQMGPGQPPMKSQATQSSKMLGDRWLVATSEGEAMGQPMTSVLTIGYDPAKKSYVGTFYCSCANELWTYTGKVSEDGKKLVLDTEGPNMSTPGKTSKYKEAITIVDADNYLFTSEIEGEDGKFVEFMKAKYSRKK
jgi:hypothetical protein